MSEFWAIRKGGALHPADVESAGEFSRLPAGKVIKVTAKQPRNAAHHRLYWVLCQRIGSGIGEEAEVVSDVLKVATGHCTVVRTKTNGMLKLPKSIAWAKMDQAEFAKFFDRCVVIICTEWGMRRPDVLEQVKDLLDDTAPERRVA